MNETQHRESVEKLRKLIGDIRVAMLITVDHEGCLRSRPMMTQRIDPDGQLWFFTKVEAAKVHEIENEHHVNLAYANPSDQVYVSVSGLAQLVRDRKKMEELWTPAHRAWFPEGLNDPGIGLLRVHVDKAEYWDSPSGMVAQAIGFAKAILTGKGYGEEDADHEKITLTK